MAKTSDRCQRDFTLLIVFWTNCQKCEILFPLVSFSHCLPVVIIYFSLIEFNQLCLIDQISQRLTDSK